MDWSDIGENSMSSDIFGYKKTVVPDRWTGTVPMLVEVVMIGTKSK